MTRQNTAQAATESASAHKLYLDLGNSETKFSFGSGVNSIRSIYAELDNPIVGSTSSPCIRFGKHTYLVGRNAKNLGKVVHEFAEASSKLQNIFIGLFSCLVPAHEGYQWKLDLTLLLPFGADKRTQDSFRKQLTSKVWDYSYNGVAASVEITKVSFCNEAVGSYNYAIANKQIEREEIVLVLDFGGNTVIARQMCEGVELWSGVLANTGAVQLASRIAQAAQAKVGTMVNVYEVIDAMAIGSLKVRGESIEQEYKRERKAWFGSILQQISYQLKNVGLQPSAKILLTGGCSLLLADEVKESTKYIICKDPVHANILGIAHDYTKGVN